MRHLVAGVLFPLVGLERGVDGKALRWQVDDESSSWTPATKTVSGVHSETMMEIEMVPTPGPEVGGTKMLGELRMRQLAGSDQICGFVGGDIGENSVWLVLLAAGLDVQTMRRCMRRGS